MVDNAAPSDFSFILASCIQDMKSSLGMMLESQASMREICPPQDPEQVKAYAVLEYETARINIELVQLASLYRLEHDNLLVQVDEHYVSDVLEEQLARNELLFKNRGIQLTVNCDENLTWYFDGELIGDVINTVLVNCSRYCRKQVHVSIEKQQNMLCISIADDGSGYPETMLAAPGEIASDGLFLSGGPRLGVLFACRIANLHHLKGIHGFVQLENSGVLNGGVFRLFLP